MNMRMCGHPYLPCKVYLLLEHRGVKRSYAMHAQLVMCL